MGRPETEDAAQGEPKVSTSVAAVKHSYEFTFTPSPDVHVTPGNPESLAGYSVRWAIMPNKPGERPQEQPEIVLRADATSFRVELVDGVRCVVMLHSRSADGTFGKGVAYEFLAKGIQEPAPASGLHMSKVSPTVSLKLADADVAPARSKQVLVTFNKDGKQFQGTAGVTLDDANSPLLMVNYGEGEVFLCCPGAAEQAYMVKIDGFAGIAAYFESVADQIAELRTSVASAT